MKIIEVIAEHGHQDTISSIAEQHGAIDYWLGPVAEDGRSTVRILVTPDSRSAVLDALQTALGAIESSRIVLIPVEATLPRLPDTVKTVAGNKSLSREELYNNVEKGCQLDGRFLFLVFLSTIVVAVGLLEDNVAVVIGAMVIAPFLGPNIALALSSALGDTRLTLKALKTNLAGISLTLFLTILLGAWWPYAIDSQELIARTHAGMDSIALAMASGAAAVLSMTTGLATVLVGVMVAVALLPPAATLGFMIGHGEYSLAAGAGLLLAVNIVCLNLAAKLGFLFLGIRPRTWLDQQRARQSISLYIIFWVLLLSILATLIYLRSQIAIK